MIGYLEGKCIGREPDGSIILNVNGVGYVIYVTKDFYNTPDLLESGKILSLFIETKMRESDITLFGFLFKEEKTWFNRLVNVQGIGGKVALNVLSIGIEQINNALFNREISVLTLADGVGKKGAERMITELAKFATAPEESVVSLVKKKQISDSSVKALLSLGYSKKEVELVVKNIVNNSDRDEVDVSSIVQLALLNLAKI